MRPNVLFLCVGSDTNWIRKLSSKIREFCVTVSSPDFVFFHTIWGTLKSESLGTFLCHVRGFVPAVSRKQKILTANSLAFTLTHICSTSELLGGISTRLSHVALYSATMLPLC